MAHTGLCGQMDNEIRAMRFKKLLQKSGRFQFPVDLREFRVLLKPGAPRFFQCWIVIRIYRVEPNDSLSCPEDVAINEIR